MRINLISFIVVCVLSFTSCITIDDLEYISSNQGFDKENIANKSSYLQVGDLVSIQISTTTEQQHDFFNQEETNNAQIMMQNPYLYGYLIKPDGFLDLPSFGRVKAEGLTLLELEDAITDIAVSYFEQPVVKINVINFAVTVLGEVNKPGTFKIFDPSVNLLYALSLAGDITQFGDRKKIKIIRKDNNINRVFYIDLTDQEVLNNPDFMLQSHDIIYVAPLAKKFYAFNNLTNIFSTALSAVTLYILITRN